MLALGLLSTAASGAVRLHPGGYWAREGDSVVVTVVRDQTKRRGAVRYAARPGTARVDLDFERAGGRLDFAPGETRATFSVRIVDDRRVETREAVEITIYSSDREPIGRPRRALLTIVDNDAIVHRRNDANPLGLSPSPPGDNPLAGARFYRNPETNLAGTVIREIRDQAPKAAKLLKVIADEPEAKRFGSFNTKPDLDVERFLELAQAEEPGSIPLLATYRLTHTRCGGYSDTPRAAARYKRWYAQFARGIGDNKAVVFFEIDALITTPCLSARGRRTRVGELRSAIDHLAALPHTVVYVDAGASDADNPRLIATMLRRIGVDRIQGFFTNATHQNHTKREIRYADRLSAATGGARYVISTATNGQGALRPRDEARDGEVIRCNAPGRGLGPRPTSDVPPEYPRLDGLFWIGNPGRSAGPCGKGDPPTGEFYLSYALSLVRNASFRIR